MPPTTKKPDIRHAVIHYEALNAQYLPSKLRECFSEKSSVFILRIKELKVLILGTGVKGSDTEHLLCFK